MLNFSKKNLCAFEAVLDIALNARPNPVQLSDLTERQKISARYLERIMQALVCADILTGQRGPQGGYLLARERRNISLADIIKAINDYEKPKNEISPLRQNIINPICDEMTQTIIKKLNTITIENLAIAANKVDGVVKPAKFSSNFDI